MRTSGREWSSGIIPWLMTVPVFVYVARRVSPLGLHDDVGYQLLFWMVVVLFASALGAVGWYLIGTDRIVTAARIGQRIFFWPRPAAPWQVAAITMIVVPILGATPRIRWMFKTGSSGTPPFSRIETSAMLVVLNPFLSRMSDSPSPSALTWLIVLFWVAVAAVASIIAVRVLRVRGFSVLGAAAIIAAVTKALLFAALLISPIEMSF